MPTRSIPITDLKPRVRGFIRARVPREEAEDVIQDAWLRIVKDWPNYDPNKGPPWPFAKFRCQSAIRDSYRRRPPTEGEMPDHTPAASPAPSVLDYEQLLQVTFAAPSELHQLIAFAHVQLLEWKPAEVVARISDEALEDLGNRFVVEYSRQFPSYDRNAILKLLQPFTERLRGERDSLADHFKGRDDKTRRDEVSHWRFSVQRRIRSDFLFQHSLEALLTSPRPPQEQIVYGLVVLLGWTTRRLAEKHCHESLKKLAERFENDCRAKRQHLWSLIQRIFRPLHQDPSLNEQTLCDHVPEGQDPADVFARWSDPSEGRKL